MRDADFYRLQEAVVTTTRQLNEAVTLIQEAAQRIVKLEARVQSLERQRISEAKP